MYYIIYIIEIRIIHSVLLIYLRGTFRVNYSVLDKSLIQMFTSVQNKYYSINSSQGSGDLKQYHIIISCQASSHQVI